MRFDTGKKGAESRNDQQAGCLSRFAIPFEMAAPVVVCNDGPFRFGFLLSEKDRRIEMANARVSSFGFRCGVKRAFTTRRFGSHT